MPSEEAAHAAAVPTPALIVTAPAADLLIVMVFVELRTGLSDALPSAKPFTGAVSEVPDVQVKITGPVMAVTAFTSVSALARDG
jgi:hypothetical protein